MKNHVKKGEKVKIISGKYKGTIGIILEIDKKAQFANIDSIPPIIKQLKKSKSSNENKKKEISKKIHISNLLSVKS